MEDVWSEIQYTVNFSTSSDKCWYVHASMCLFAAYISKFNLGRIWKVFSLFRRFKFFLATILTFRTWNLPIIQFLPRSQNLKCRWRVRKFYNSRKNSKNLRDFRTAEYMTRIIICFSPFNNDGTVCDHEYFFQGYFVIFLFKEKRLFTTKKGTYMYCI